MSAAVGMLGNAWSTYVRSLQLIALLHALFRIMQDYHLAVGHSQQATPILRLLCGYDASRARAEYLVDSISAPRVNTSRRRYNQVM